MNTTTILNDFHRSKTISEIAISSILRDNELRNEFVHHFRKNKDREFALALLDKFISIRKNPNGEISAEYLMFACYILGLHKQLEDSLKIWEVKNVDFDTYCGLDIQLVVFGGVNKTLDFLKQQKSEESEKALAYINECKISGDFDTLEEYYLESSLPWFI